MISKLSIGNCQFKICVLFFSAIQIISFAGARELFEDDFKGYGQFLNQTVEGHNSWGRLDTLPTLMVSKVGDKIVLRGAGVTFSGAEHAIESQNSGVVIATAEWKMGYHALCSSWLELSGKDNAKVVVDVSGNRIGLRMAYSGIVGHEKKQQVAGEETGKKPQSSERIISQLEIDLDNKVAYCRWKASGSKTWATEGYLPLPDKFEISAVSWRGQGHGIPYLEKIAVTARKGAVNNVEVALRKSSKVLMSVQRRQNPSDECGAELVIENKDSSRKDLILNTYLYDIFGNPLDRNTQKFQLKPDETNRILVPVSPQLRVGVVRGELKSIDGTVEESLTEFIAIEPESKVTVDGCERFGLIMYPYHNASDEERMLELIRTCGLKAIRGFEMNRFYDHENKTIVPERYDRVVKRLREAGVTHILSILAYTPPWASTVSSDRSVLERRFAMPQMDVWVELVRRYVKNKCFDSFEVWNEPNGGFWATMPKDKTYAHLVRETYKAVKQVRPDAPVVVGSANNGSPNWPDRVLTFAPGCADVVSFHTYRYGGFGGRLCHPEKGSPTLASYMEIADELHKMLMKHSIGGKKMSLWDTEFGYRAPEEFDPRFDMEEQAKYYVRSYLVQAAVGVEKSFGFLMRDARRKDHTFGLCRRDWSIKPSWLAFRTLNGQAASRTFGQLHKHSANLYSVTLRGDADNVLALWSVDNPAIVAIEGQVLSVCDLYGRKLKGRDISRMNLYTIPAGSVIYLRGAGIDSNCVMPLIEVLPQTEGVVKGEFPLYKINKSLLAQKLLGEIPSECSVDGKAGEHISDRHSKGYGSVILKTSEGSFVVPVKYPITESIATSLSYTSDGLPQIIVENGQSKTVKVRVSAMAADGSLKKDKEIIIPERTRAFYELDWLVPSLPNKGREIKVCLKHDKKISTSNFEIWKHAVAKSISPVQATVDMQISQDNSIDLLEWRQDTGQKLPSKGDLSARVAFDYDDKNLYLFAEVEDDIHSQPNARESAVDGDSLQFAFATKGSDQVDEMLYYLTDDGRKSFYAFNWNMDTEADFDFDIERTGTKTKYKVAVPLSYLQVKRGDSVRFSLTINENDTGTRDGYLRWSDGIGSGKDYSRYGTVVLK